MPMRPTRRRPPRSATPVDVEMLVKKFPQRLRDYEYPGEFGSSGHYLTQMEAVREWLDEVVGPDAVVPAEFLGRVGLDVASLFERWMSQASADAPMTKQLGYTKHRSPLNVEPRNESP